MNNKENLERLLQDVRDACALSEADIPVSAEDAPCAPESEEDYISILSVFERRTPHPERHSPAAQSCASVGDDDECGFFEWMMDSLKLNRRPVRDDHRTTPGRVVHTAACMLLSLLVLGVVAGYILFAHDLKAMASIKQVEVNANAYSMVYSGDYGFDEFLGQGGASTEDELMDYLGSRFVWGMGDMPRLTEDSVPTEESVLAARNPRRLMGTLAGRTISRSEETLAMVVTVCSSSGRESVSTVDLSRLGYTPYNRPEGFNRYAALASVYLPLDGMNAHGVVVTALESSSDNAAEDTEKPDLTATTAVRLLLDRARSADHAADLLAGYDIFPSGGRYYDFAVSDISGRALVISTAGGTVTVSESPCAVNDGITTPQTAHRSKNAGRMEALRDTYAQYDGYMTKPQMFSAMRRTMLSGDGWMVVYDTGRFTAEYCFGGDYDRQYAVAIN